MPADWKKARTRQTDRDGRWTLKRGKKRSLADDSGPKRQATEIIFPAFGYKNHVGIDRAHDVIRRSTVTHDAATTVANSRRCSIATTCEQGVGG